MFKKPRRHFRQRKNTEGSDNDEDHDADDQGNSNLNYKTKLPTAPANLNFKKKDSHSNSKGSKPDTKKALNVAPISFELDGEEDEAFQIKKPSQSRKIIKRLKKEKKQEKDGIHQPSNGSRHQGNDSISVVLNGDRALDMDLDSDCEPDTSSKQQEEDKPRHSFRSVLERGEIPDANLIHLARKKRAQAREQGDFIPLDDTEKVETAPKSSQRLIRDDDNDMSDEERVDFTINAAQRERQHMKDTFLAAEHGSDEDSDQERDWEEQQIRKVVGASGREPQVPVDVDGYSSYYSMGHVDPSQMSTAYDRNIPDQMNMKPLPSTISIDQVKRSLTERLSNLQIVHRVHTQERDNVNSGLVQSRKSTEELESKSSDSQIAKLNAKYTFIQQIRSYIRDLLDCLNEKYTRISELDYALMCIAKSKSEKLCKRRQEDIRDEASDCASINKAVVVGDTPAEKRQQAVKLRRIADREARRTRRRQARQNTRQKLLEPHNDGLSSDDEESKSDLIKYQSEREKRVTEAKAIFDDVVEEFSTVSGVLEKFESWKHKYSDDYNDAYVGLCLPKLLSPLIKLSLVDWNPLEESRRRLSDMSWYRSVSLYGHSSTDTSSVDPADPDNLLIPMIVEKVLIAKLTGCVDMVWDPVSKSQTHSLCTLLHELVDDYPTLNTSSKHTATLLKAISMRINISLDEDTFMPLFTNDLLKKSVEARSFLHRQIWSNIKLFRNILQFSTLLSDSKLQHLALDCLLNRYIMLGLQCAGTVDSLKRIKAVTDALPSHWLKSANEDTTLPQLENLCRYMRSCATACHQSDQRDELKGLLRIFVNIHALDHAKWMSDEFSLRMPK